MRVPQLSARVLPHSSASGWECSGAASVHKPPSSSPPQMDQTEPGRSRAAGSPRGSLTDKHGGETGLAPPSPADFRLLPLMLTSHRAAVGDLPEDQAHGIYVCPLERLKVLHVYGVVQDLWSHIPEQKTGTA